MIQVVLGVDPSTTRLGLALVGFEPPHVAWWARTFEIDRPDGGWLAEQIADALRSVPSAHVIVRVGIERAINHRDPGNSFDAGGVYGIVLDRCHRLWPWAVQVPRLVPTWKRDVLGKGNASKAEVMAWAESLGLADAWDESQDSADALGIAVSAAMVELEGADG